MDFKITIIVPVFNEAGNLLRLEQELRYFIRDAPVTAMVLFINDGSTDQSQSIIESICDRNPEFNYIQFSKNAGLSAALKAGFEHTKTELIGYIDADLQTSPEDFNLLLEHIENYDLVTGVRQHRKDSALKKTSSIVANTVRRLFTKDGMDDTGCPLKIMKTEYAKGIPMFKGLHRFLPAMILLQNGTVKQVPVQHFPRREGVSKFGLRQRLISPLIDCFAYLWMKKKTINYNIKKSSTN
ncbi:MAG: glycosyltransferase involved in cell wall biosynthesis [Psychroserpens sp.]|jgi:glycosyltransferase involved in cell wall biosynthesis|uniref:glycosyltransferase family 2 protein n=1 Tax=Psychroserpens sp. TaxID=2020870 RepID=UPI0039E60E23